MKSFVGRKGAKQNMPSERPRKGRPQQVGSLIPEAARALGFEAELELARRTSVFNAVLLQVAPHLAAKCRMVGSERGRLIVEADDRAAAQELHLRGGEMASAYSLRADGDRALGVSVRLTNLDGEARKNE